MSKFFEYIGLLALICFSFFITERTSIVAKNMDEIMINIKSNYLKYEREPIDSIVENNYITIGYCGKNVDINRSYFEMKKNGIYDDKLYQYNYVYPNNNLHNNYDKYIISGSRYKNYIYILVNLNENNKYLLNNYKFVNFNFIVNKSFYLSNINLINRLIDNNNSILIEETSFKDFKNIFKEYKKYTNFSIYCYNNNLNNDFLKLCSSNKSGTIGRIELYSENYLLHLKKNLKNGNFYNFTLNKELIKSIYSINSFLNQKGIEKSNVDDNLVEC